MIIHMPSRPLISLLMPLLFAEIFLSQRAAAQAAPASSGTAGQQVFSATCAACHGLDGRGGEHAPHIAAAADIRHLSNAELTHIIRNGIPGAGMPGFGSSLGDDGIKAVVTYLRVLQGKSEAVPLAGDAVRGRALFFGEARCSECHIVNGTGGFLGADLSGYGQTHSPASIRESIVDPDKNLDMRHGTVTAVTRTGKKLTGIIRNEDNFSLQMQTTDGNFHLFDKTDLTKIEHEPRSLMPSDYGRKLSAAQLDDLVSFLARTPGAQAVKRDNEGDQ